MTDKQFPQVADDELMLTQMPHMNLYDDGDFISNILGEYTDKNYLEWEPIATGKVAEQPYQKIYKNPFKNHLKCLSQEGSR